MYIVIFNNVEAITYSPDPLHLFPKTYRRKREYFSVYFCDRILYIPICIFRYQIFGNIVVKKRSSLRDSCETEDIFGAVQLRDDGNLVSSFFLISVWLNFYRDI